MKQALEIKLFGCDTSMANSVLLMNEFDREDRTVSVVWNSFFDTTSVSNNNSIDRSRSADTDHA